MREYRTETVVREDGTVAVKDLPFRPGERVEVVVQQSRPARAEGESKYPLRGKGPYRFDDPFSPVGIEDWEEL